MNSPTSPLPRRTLATPLLAETSPAPLPSSPLASGSLSFAKPASLSTPTLLPPGSAGANTAVPRSVGYSSQQAADGGIAPSNDPGRLSVPSTDDDPAGKYGNRAGTPLARYIKKTLNIDIQPAANAISDASGLLWRCFDRGGSGSSQNGPADRKSMFGNRGRRRCQMPSWWIVVLYLNLFLIGWHATLAVWTLVSCAKWNHSIIRQFFTPCPYPGGTVLPKDFIPKCPSYQQIPRVAQYVFDSSVSPRAFTFWNYLSIKSARKQMDTDLILFHYPHLPPTGPWFKLAKRYVTLSRIQRVDIYAWSLIELQKRMSNMYLYVQQMLKNGGLLLTPNTIVLRPLDDVLHNRQVFFQTTCEGEFSPDIFLATPNSEFMVRWEKALLGQWYWLGWWVGHPGERGGLGTLASRIGKYIPEEVSTMPMDMLRSVPEESVWDFLDSVGGPTGNLTAISVISQQGSMGRVTSRDEIIKAVMASKVAMSLIGDEDWEDVKQLLKTVGLGASASQHA